MTEKKDHLVEMWTCNGDKLAEMMTEADARQLEEAPFNPESNVAITQVTLPQDES